MKRISIVIILFLVLSISITSAQCPIFSNGTTVASLLQQSWGQSFVPGCSTNINYMTFNTATAVNSEFTFTLRNGSDCSGTVIHTQKLAQIVDGENRVDFATPIPVVAGNTYYFSVESDLNSTFKVRFSNSSLVPGNLKTHNAGSPKSACDRNFPNYDWNFSVDTTSIVVPPPPPPTGFPTLGQNVDLYIWAGQSNAQGWKGDATYYPADPSNLDPFIGLNYAFINSTSSSGNWIKMQAQEGLFTNGHFGPEVTFSRKLKEDGFNPAIFKYSKGSTSIYSFWKTPGSDGYYDKMIVELNKAIAVLEQKGYKVTIRGFVWIQGESDATIDAAPLYYASLQSIVRDLRTNVAKNNLLPIVLGVDEQHSGVRAYPIIVESQQRIAREEVNVIFTSMYGLPKADGTHLTPAGLISHGVRLFDAYKTLNLTASKPELKKKDYKLQVSDNHLIVSCQSPKIELSVYNVLGHLVTSKSSQQGSIEIPLNKGCYIVKMDTNEQQIIQKIINL